MLLLLLASAFPSLSSREFAFYGVAISERVCVDWYVSVAFGCRVWRAVVIALKNRLIYLCRYLNPLNCEFFAEGSFYAAHLVRNTHAHMQTHTHAHTHAHTHTRTAAT